MDCFFEGTARLHTLAPRIVFAGGANFCPTSAWRSIYVADLTSFCCVVVAVDVFIVVVVVVVLVAILVVVGVVRVVVVVLAIVVGIVVVVVVVVVGFVVVVGQKPGSATNGFGSDRLRQ